MDRNLLDDIMASLLEDLGSLAEWATLVVALTAVVLTLVSLGLSRRATRRSDLVRMHEYLMSKELQTGRRILHEAYKQNIPMRKIRRNRRKWDSLNHAVSAFQMLAELADNGIINRREARRLWGGHLSRFWPKLEGYVRFRRADEGHDQAWADLVKFAKYCGATVTLDN